MIRLAAISLLGVTAHGGRSAQVSLSFSAQVQPVNRLAWEQIGDIVIADSDCFGVHYHRAFVIDGGETLMAEGLTLSETEVAAR